MKTQIDIYADNPVVTLEYKIAVMQAATCSPIQFRFTEAGAAAYPLGGISINGIPVLPTITLWQALPPGITPVFSWDMYQYRVDPAANLKAPVIAAGHNPDKLTEECVGIAQGWRLLSHEESKYRNSLSVVKRVERGILEIWKAEVSQHWSTTNMDGESIWGGNAGFTYRTKKPVGFFLPPKKKKVQLHNEDFIGHPVIWVRRNAPGIPEHLVTCIQADRFSFGDRSYSLGSFMDSKWQYSFDRATWKEFYKEVDELPSSNF